MSDFGPGTEMLHFPWIFPSSCWLLLMKAHWLLFGKNHMYIMKFQWCSQLPEEEMLHRSPWQLHFRGSSVGLTPLGWKKPGQGLNLHVMKQEEAKKSHIDPAGATDVVNSQGFIRKLALSSFFPWSAHPGLVEGVPAESSGLEWDEI